MSEESKIMELIYKTTNRDISSLMRINLVHTILQLLTEPNKYIVLHEYSTQAHDFMSVSIYKRCNA